MQNGDNDNVNQILTVGLFRQELARGLAPLILKLVELEKRVLGLEIEVKGLKKNMASLKEEMNAIERQLEEHNMLIRALLDRTELLHTEHYRLAKYCQKHIGFEL